MAPKSKISSLLFSVGLLFISCALLVSTRTNIPDYAKGIFFGVGIGIIALSLFSKKFRSRS
ncbi:MAG: hypothetical protein EOO48_03005 [Flavobacterium sp.]|nr:MAG: hypothetical protein EOO48_03005 [Flavobacterium sp.]